MYEKSKIATYKKWIIIFSLTVGGLHLFGSVVQFFFPTIKGMTDLAERMTLIALEIAIAFLFLELDKDSRRIYLKKYFSKEQLLLSGIFAALVLSSFCNGLWKDMTIWRGNFEHRFDAFVCVFVLFPIGRFYGIKENIHRVENAILDLSLLILATAMGVILICTFQGKLLHTVKDYDYAIGMQVYNETLQLGMNCHPNTVGVYSGLLFLLCIYLVWKNRGVKRVLYVAEALIHYVVLALSNSRGAYFSMLCVAACMAGVIVYYVLPHKNTYRKWMTTFLAGILIFVLLLIQRNMVFSFYAMVSPPKTTVVNDSGKTVQQDEVIRNLNIGFVNGRQIIWKCALRLITENPLYMLLGVTPYQVSVMLGQRLEWEIDVYTHNQILEVAADTGIPAMVLFLVFLFLVAAKCLKLGVKPIKIGQWKRKLLLLILLFLVLVNIMEATLLFYHLLSGSVFMLLCGWVCKCSEHETLIG